MVYVIELNIINAIKPDSYEALCEKIRLLADQIGRDLANGKFVALNDNIADVGMAQKAA